MPIEEATPTNRQRRKQLRFPLQTALRYHVITRSRQAPVRGTGKVQVISSRGLAFRSDEPLQRGMHLSVSMVWPAILDNQCLLRLTFDGKVLRARSGLVIVTVEHAHFRTAGRSTAIAGEETTALASIKSALSSRGLTHIAAEAV